MNLALTLAVLLATSSGASRSRTPAATAERLFDRGQDEFIRGEFNVALKTLDSAAESAREDGLTAKIHLLRGQIYAAQQRRDEAEDAFAKTLEFDPEASLDPQRVDPAVVKLLDRVRGRLRGELRVRADADAGRVYLNGKSIGTLPYKGDLPIGRHRLEVKGSDGREASRDVVLAANRVVVLDLALAVPEVEVRPDPPQKDEPIANPTWLDHLHLAGGQLVIDLRAGFEPANAEWFGMELGVGAELRHFRALVDLRYSPTTPGLWGFTLRGHGRLPVKGDRVVLYAGPEVPLFFTPYAAIGLGAALGAEVKLTKWVSVFGEGGARYFFNARSPFQPFRGAVTFGLQFGLGK